MKRVHYIRSVISGIAIGALVFSVSGDATPPSEPRIEPHSSVACIVDAGNYCSIGAPVCYEPGPCHYCPVGQHMKCGEIWAATNCSLYLDLQFGEGKNCGYEYNAYCQNLGTPEEPDWQCVDFSTSQRACGKKYCEATTE